MNDVNFVGGEVLSENHLNTAAGEVMSAVHAHLPQPHDPFADLVPPQGIRLTPRH